MNFYKIRYIGEETMAVDFSHLLYLQCQDQFSRPVIVTPRVSDPTSGSFNIRGIFSTRPIDIITDVGTSMVSDQQTILDVRDQEFFDLERPVPKQGDLINIPGDGNIPDEGDWEVTDCDANGGGETTLTIRRYLPALP